MTMSLPYFKKSENNETIVDAFHGTGGPINVATSRTDNPFQQLFLDAVREAQLPLTDDFNGVNQEGCGLYQVTQINGERCSAARAYIHPHAARRNLTIMTGAVIDRLVIKDGRATGAIVRVGKETKTLRAKREIVLAAGAFGTPAILMRSGVGDGRALQEAGVTVTHHLPAVGKNLQDHPDFAFGYRSDNLDLLGYSLKGFQRLYAAAQRYKRERRGPVTTNFRGSRRLSQDKARSTRARHPVAFHRRHRRRSRAQETLGPRLLVPRLSAAAGESRNDHDRRP